MSVINAGGEVTPVLVPRALGRQPYLPVWNAMRAFTDRRGPGTLDEVWLLEHDAVFTLGQAGRAEHLIDPGPIPVVQSDRGGQVTYHGPGQLVAYVLLDLRRARLGVRGLVGLLERAVVDLLAEEGVVATSHARGPGVYVTGAKVASIGLRVRNGCSYHGIALNVDLDLGPFARIDPCGYPGLVVTRLADLGVSSAMSALGDRLAHRIGSLLGYGIHADSAGVALGGHGAGWPAERATS